MQVSIVGGHGAIARLLSDRLVARGDIVTAVIRNPDHAGELSSGGLQPVVCDIERADSTELAEAIGSPDVVVFAAGAGPGSGAERKETVDYGGAVKLMEAAGQREVARYVMVSSIGADPDHVGDEVFDVYLRAKGRADAALMGSGLDYVIVRPGRLTDDPGTGRVSLGPDLPRGSVPRADVASVLAELIHTPGISRETLVVVGGDTPVESAVASLAAQ